MKLRFLILLYILNHSLFNVVFAAENDGLPELNWSTLYVVNDDIIWLGNRTGDVAVSSDGGSTWNITSPGGRTANLEIRQLKAFDDRHAYALSTGRGERSRLLVTRNGGFSWRQLYRGNGEEQLRCFALIPDGEAWVLGDTLNDQWHVVRSSNGNHWLASRSGFAETPLVGEAASNEGNCAVYANGNWVLGTLNAAEPRIMYKTRSALRFQVTPTPLTGGLESGIHAVFPLAQRDFLIAGGAAADYAEPELFRYQSGSFSQLSSPPITGALTQMTVVGNAIVAGNLQGLYFSRDLGNSWSQISDTGALAVSCHGDGSCWFINREHELHQTHLTTN